MSLEIRGFKKMNRVWFSVFSAELRFIRAAVVNDFSVLAMT